MIEQAPITKKHSKPLIVYGEGIDPTLSLDPDAAAQTMRELGVSETAIANSAVYIDPKNRLLNYGTHYSSRLEKLRFRFIPELRDVEGDIVRLSTIVRGRERTAEQMNKTATHEWEHVAQDDRQDRKVTEGHIAIFGFTALGALVGKRLSNDSKVGTAIGGFLGYHLGYRIAPHERQARLRAGQVRGGDPQVVSMAIQREIK